MLVEPRAAERTDGRSQIVGHDIEAVGPAPAIVPGQIRYQRLLGRVAGGEAEGQHGPEDGEGDARRQ